MSTLARMFRPKIIHSDSAKMKKLTPDLYQELLRYKRHDQDYFLQPIDFSCASSLSYNQKVA